tara:strand:+ start:697 stop:825 length:129 start_codon:yes stop_codon:yes gene_type:complete
MAWPSVSENSGRLSHEVGGSEVHRKTRDTEGSLGDFFVEYLV